MNMRKMLTSILLHQLSILFCSISKDNADKCLVLFIRPFTSFMLSPKLHNPVVIYWL